MSDTWTLVSGYTASNYSDDIVWEVDPATKKLAQISGQALVAGEENSQYIVFQMDRYWDGIDISGMTINIMYELNATYFGTSTAVAAEITDDSLRFGWIVPAEACCVTGTLLFVLVITDTDYTLKTQIATTSVYSTISEDDVVPEPTSAAWYETFQTRVDAALDNAENALSQAQSVLAQAQTYVGAPLVASTVAGMTDTSRVYVYVGSEDGYTSGNWYYYNGSAWTSGGVYNAVAVNTDTTLTQSGVPADAEATGDAISALNADLSAKVNSVKNVIALEATSVTYEMLTGKVIGATGIVTNASGEAYKVSDYIPVVGGTVVTCAYSRARWGNQNWAFYDADKNVVSTYGKTASNTTVEYFSKIIVPLNANYFVLARDENSISGEPDSDVTIITKYAEAINSAPKSAVRSSIRGAITETIVTAEDSSGKIIGTRGNVVSTSSTDYRVSTMSVNNGDVLNIRNCQARYANKMYSFYDASGLPICSQDRVDDDAHNFMLLEVPFGAVTLAVSGFQSYATVHRVTNVAEGGWTGKKWAMIGDSITDANNQRATKRYFDYIAEVTGITTVNLGLSGTGYKKPYNSNLPFYQRVDTVPTDSDVITIFGSGNDCSLTLGTPTDSTSDTVCGCINLTIDGIRNRITGANIGIITPTPWMQYPTTTPDNAMDLYADALVEICRLKGVPCLDLYHCSNMLPWVESFRTAFYKHDDGDGTHPDEDGHKLFAPRIKAFLEALLM